MAKQTEISTEDQGLPTGEEPSFGQALESLEGILQRIEGEEIDLDQLATELRQGARLLELCRAKIRRAEVEVSQIVQSLDSEKSDSEV